MLKVWCARIVMFREALLNMAKRLPPILVNLDRNQIEEALTNEAENIINAFAKNGKYTPRPTVNRGKAGN
jgi:hypothetical protein